MGTKHLRRSRTYKLDVLSRRALRGLIVPTSLVSFAAVAGVLLSVHRSGPDLGALIPRVPDLDGYTLVAWSNLERGQPALKVGGLAGGTAARVLVDMMDGTQPIHDGQLTACFVLLPDAGSAIHPGHRFGDQMIEVRLPAGEKVRFSEGSLVWVWGTWRVLAGNPDGHDPLYQLVDARLESATKADIPKYFR